MSLLSGLRLRVDNRWSKLTLIGATILFAISLVTFIGTSHHKKQHFEHEDHENNNNDSHAHSHHRENLHSDGKRETRIRLHHFAAVGLATSVTGVVSAFNIKRRWALVCLILIIIAEVTALGVVGFESSNAAKKCVMRSMAAFNATNCSAENCSVPEFPRGEMFDDHNEKKKKKFRKPHSHSKSKRDSNMFSEERVGDPDADVLGGCLFNVRRAGVIACLIVCVIACCCGSRYTDALAADHDDEEVTDLVAVSSTSCTTATESDDAVLMTAVVPTTALPPTQ